LPGGQLAIDITWLFVFRVIKDYIWLAQSLQCPAATLKRHTMKMAKKNE
jgi:hypothetical protein